MRLPVLAGRVCGPPVAAIHLPRGLLEGDPMFNFWKTRLTKSANPALPSLGHLEEGVMEVLWTNGDSNVRDVVDRLERPLAYTTIMTTLDRLFKKGLLDRRREARAFIYSARVSREQWERGRAGELVAGFLAVPQPRHDLLVSCLVDAVGQHDRELLADLEKKIRSARRKLSRGARR
jgi:predicted transcriptional regulator